MHLIKSAVLGPPRFLLRIIAAAPCHNALKQQRRLSLIHSALAAELLVAVEQRRWHCSALRRDKKHFCTMAGYSELLVEQSEVCI